MALSDHDSLRAERRQALRRAFAASLAGTSLEWYDFAVYGAAAALVFGQLFFPSEDALTGTLKAFGTYAVGYISRPVGGIVFGRLGDVIGRKRVLIWTLLLIGAATVLIGLLPTYAAAGYAGPAMLVLLRFAQGVGVGGEWGGAVLLTSEFTGPDERGFWASAAQVGPPLGTLLANGVLALLAGTLTGAQFLDWGWRLAFLLSAALVAFGLAHAVFHALAFAEARFAILDGFEPGRFPFGEGKRFGAHGVAFLAALAGHLGADEGVFEHLHFGLRHLHRGIGRRRRVFAAGAQHRPGAENGHRGQGDPG